MPEIPDPFRAPVVYTLPGMDEARTDKDIVYRTDGDTSLLMDVYHPIDAKPGERRPAVIFTHGDAPPEILAFAKDWGAYIGWGRLAAASGLVGVTFNHRSTLQFSRTDDAIGDILAAVDFVRDNADRFGVDPSRICFAVYSAGGFALQPILSANPDYIRCIVAYYPVLDLPAWLKGFAPNVNFDALARYSAINHVSDKAAPMLLARAGRDNPGLNGGIDRFTAAAFNAGMELAVLNHATGQHAFDMLDDNDRSREIIEATLAFMRRHLLAE